MDETQKAIEKIRSYNGKPVTLMEVCGTHSMNIARFGIRQLLPESVKLVSGPGCPVCVTPDDFFDKAYALCKRQDVIITSFGDLLRIPASGTTLQAQKGFGADLRIVYSPLDALEIAKQNPNKKVVFLSVGFETTAPLTALAVQTAKLQAIDHFYILCGNKTMIPAMKALISDSEIKVDGFILPGNVSVIIGENPFSQLLCDTGIKGVICGFEATHILNGIEYLLFCNEYGVRNLYKSAVLPEGNVKAQQIMNDVFIPCDSEWRGLGNIPLSGLCLAKEYETYDAQTLIEEIDYAPNVHMGCLCGEVLKGKITPMDCPLFKKTCTPTHPIGPCMVSSEGACAAYFMGGE